MVNLYFYMVQIPSRYEFYTIENCGLFYSHSPKYVHKDFVRL